MGRRWELGTIGPVSTAAGLAYVATAILIAWGTAHLAPTRSVVASFGAISADNRRILAMEWMAEGVSHIAIGVLVILATAIEGAVIRRPSSSTSCPPGSS
jgi:hypothetical protein